jgi:hypothetical protein
MTNAEKLFLDLWKLTYGYEWVEWFDAMQFKSSLGFNQIILSALVDQWVFDLEESIGTNSTRIKLRKTEPVSVKGE